MASDQKRVYIWTVPRSLSSAFFRAITNAVGTKGIFEPYCEAYYFGTERVSCRYSEQPPTQGKTFSDIKALVEGPHPGERAIFVKDVAFALLAGPKPLMDSIPTGYTHTFLIRNPLKSLPSFYKITTDKDATGWDHFEPKETGFKEIYDLYNAVTQDLGQEAIILDADDILSYAEDMIHQYCDKTGLEFQRVMLHWDEALPEKMDVFKDWPEGWFKTMLSSNAFRKDANKPAQDISVHPQVVQQAIQESQPYYEKLYKLRLKPRGEGN